MAANLCLEFDSLYSPISDNVPDIGQYSVFVTERLYGSRVDRKCRSSLRSARRSSGMIEEWDPPLPPHPLPPTHTQLFKLYLSAFGTSDPVRPIYIAPWWNDNCLVCLSTNHVSDEQHCFNGVGISPCVDIHVWRFGDRTSKTLSS